jgi:hypothetical protein
VVVEARVSIQGVKEHPVTIVDNTFNFPLWFYHDQNIPCLRSSIGFQNKRLQGLFLELKTVVQILPFIRRNSKKKHDANG